MPPSTSWKEVVTEGEDTRFGGYAEELGAMQKQLGEGAGGVSRALHAKGNAGLLARFEVLADTPEEARVGLFAEPRAYDALVRFSNGAARRQNDKEPDVRGLGVKVIGVGGRKLIPGMEDERTQDFLAIRSPATPVRNADEFMKLVRAARRPATAPFSLLFSVGPLRLPGLLGAVVKSINAPVKPLAETAYYSAAPITFGPYAVHFAFLPKSGPAPAEGPADHPVVRGLGVDSLGDALAADVARRDLVWDFCVQFFTDEKNTPIEDNSVEWLAASAPFVRIGRLTIPTQDVKSARGKKVGEWIETLSFDPWHARTDLRPIGSIMRARNHAYRVSTQNRKAAKEPAEVPSFD
ncbi:MAG: hypothetical protein U0414_02490 [Polyangiaceae bacterium]